MKVHNIYSDILLSLGQFLNNILDKKIKNFQYNISSPGLVIEYDPNFELPAAILTYSSTTYLNARPSTFLNFKTKNINQIPVLHDLNKNISLSIQEDHFNINIDVIINYDSQLEAINDKHQIENLLPINKFLQAYKFSSYFNIDEEFLNPYLFDVVNDEIVNLLAKHDTINDKLVYCFSVSYEPLIKLTSSSINISEISSSSYSLNLSFELLMQLPSKLFFNYSSINQENAKYNDVRYLKYSNVKVPVNNTKYLELKLKKVSDNNIEYFNINCPCEEIEPNTLYGKYNYSKFNLEFNLKILDKIEYIIIPSLIYNNELYDNVLCTFRTGLINNYGIIDTKYITGKIVKLSFKDDNLVEFYFEGEINNEKVNKLFSDLEYVFVDKQYKIDIPKITFSEEPINLLNYKLLQSDTLLFSIKNLNKYRNEINYDLTSLVGITFFNLDINEYTEVFNFPPLIINNNGTFQINISNMIIKGSIDKKTSRISILDFTDINLNKIENLKIHELIFNIIFNYYPIRGPSNIEQITVNFNLIDEVISDISPIIMNQYSPKNFNLIIDKPKISEKDSNNRYSIEIPLTQYNTEIIKAFSFYFNFTKYITNENKLDLIIDLSKTTTSNVVFTFTEDFYFKHMIKVNKTNPIFFSTVLKETSDVFIS